MAVATLMVVLVLRVVEELFNVIMVEAASRTVAEEMGLAVDVECHKPHKPDPRIFQTSISTKEGHYRPLFKQYCSIDKNGVVLDPCRFPKVFEAYLLVYHVWCIAW